MRRFERRLQVLNAIFQSTHPVWDATAVLLALEGVVEISIHASRMGCDLTPYVKSACREFQSTHPVWDATNADDLWVADLQISIHASRMGCDEPWGRRADGEQKFQSTHPVWDATGSRVGFSACFFISIHASRMGCDYASTAPDNIFPDDFNPRIPYGMRPLARRTSRSMSSFQSTHPVWDATRQERLVVENQDFNPRIPYGMRPDDTTK